ncbi:MAG: hypothetical protein ABIG44_11500 [Planctomycetota bacterium]
MISDLRNILDGWDYEPGKISVRKIIGRNGQEKVQTRIDMGVLQIELDDRPDGECQFGHESYLDFLEHQLAKHAELYGDDDDYVLTPEDCQELRHEAYLYYQRYLSLFVLEDFERVVRDTTRNLRVIDFCERFAGAEEDRVALSKQRGYVLMMNIRAQAYLALADEDFGAALATVDAGIAQVRSLTMCPREEEYEEDNYAEERVLKELRREIIEKMPADDPLRLQTELAAALAQEDYEQAASIRDALLREGIDTADSNGE